MREKETVAIDSGHPSLFRNGEVNWGAISKNGVKEVEVNFEIAKILQNQLEKKGFEVILTRQDNTTIIENDERIRIAAESGAQFILRLHCDQDRYGDTTKNGVRTFYPPEEAEWISEESKKVARIIQEEVVKATGLFDGGINDDKVADIDPEIGMLVGSREANKYRIPTVLVEMVYLSNEADAEWIIAQKHKELMAEGLTNGVGRVFEEILVKTY